MNSYFTLVLEIRQIVVKHVRTQNVSVEVGRVVSSTYNYFHLVINLLTEGRECPIASRGESVPVYMYQRDPSL